MYKCQIDHLYAGRSRNRSSFPGGEETFLHSFQTDSVPTQSPFPRVSGALCPEVGLKLSGPNITTLPIDAEMKDSTLRSRLIGGCRENISPPLCRKCKWIAETISMEQGRSFFSSLFYNPVTILYYTASACIGSNNR